MHALHKPHLVPVHIIDGSQHLLHVSLDMRCRQVDFRAVRQGPEIVLQVLKHHVHVAFLLGGQMINSRDTTKESASLAGNLAPIKACKGTRVSYELHQALTLWRQS